MPSKLARAAAALACSCTTTTGLLASTPPENHAVYSLRLPDLPTFPKTLGEEEALELYRVDPAFTTAGRTFTIVLQVHPFDARHRIFCGPLTTLISPAQIPDETTGKIKLPFFNLPQSHPVNLRIVEECQRLERELLRPLADATGTYLQSFLLGRESLREVRSSSSKSS